MAKIYSQDGSARYGGELGLSGRGQWVQEFADVAFSLTDPNKVSRIVRTEFGFHILQLIEKRGDKVNVRHIIIKPEIAESEYERCLNRLDSIAEDIRAGKFSFDEAAPILSDDKDTKYNHPDRMTIAKILLHEERKNKEPKPKVTLYFNYNNADFEARGTYVFHEEEFSDPNLNFEPKWDTTKI